MKNTKICPKCKSDNIVRFDGYNGTNFSGNSLKVGIIPQSTVNVNRYVCCSCGFTEEWIDMEDMDMIVKSRRAKR